MEKQKKHVVEKQKNIAPKNYKPSAKEEFMNPVMLEYFRVKLLTWYNQIIERSITQQDELTAENLELSGIVLESKNRNTQILKRLEDALQRISNGTYGYCEVTDEPIEIKRLEACPDAIMSREAQEMHEDGLL